MDTNITKAEIQVMIEVQAKSSEHLAIIAKNLQDISARGEKIQITVNGIGKEVTDGLCMVIKECEVRRTKDIEVMKKIAEDVKRDTTFLKWIYTGLFGLLALAWLITKLVIHLMATGVPK